MGFEADILIKLGKSPSNSDFRWLLNYKGVLPASYVGGEMKRGKAINVLF